MSEFDRVMESWEAMSLPGVSVVRSYIAALETELRAAEGQRDRNWELHDEVLNALALMTARHDGEQKAKAKAEKAVERLREELTAAHTSRGALTLRAEQAEAEVARLKWQRDYLASSGINCIASTRQREEEMRQEVVNDRIADLDRRWTARAEEGGE
jgi:hypothetical protein